MAATVDPHTLAREGLVFLESDGALARWVEQAIEVLKDLDWSYRGLHTADTVTEAALEDGYTALNTVHELLCDLVSGGGFYDDKGRAEAMEFVEVMVR